MISTAIHRWFHISKLDWIDWWPHDQTDGKGKGEKGNLIFPPRLGIFRQTVRCNSTHRCKVKGLMPAKPCTNLVNKVEIVNYESGVILGLNRKTNQVCINVICTSIVAGGYGNPDTLAISTWHSFSSPKRSYVEIYWYSGAPLAWSAAQAR